MSRITSRFAEAKQLIPYVMAGFPDIATSAAVISELVSAGCSIVEVGIPYSDPVADGPTIQRAAEAALAEGVTTDDVLNMVAELKAKQDFSPVLMVYYNLVYRYGIESFAHKAAAAGVEGLIIPDLSVEESAEWRHTAAGHALDTVFLVAPTSSPERIAKITEVASGFVYCVSLTGVTGARQELPSTLMAFVGKVRENTQLPLAVGFGVSTPEQAKDIAGFADGIVVGSAFVDLIQRAEAGRGAEAVGRKAGELIQAMR